MVLKPVCGLDHVGGRMVQKNEVFSWIALTIVFFGCVGANNTIFNATACFGIFNNYLRLECEVGEVINVVKILHGAKVKQSDCVSPATSKTWRRECCRSQETDCKIDIQDGSRGVCEGQRACQPAATWSTTMKECDQDRYPVTTNYMQIVYKCMKMLDQDGPSNGAIKVDPITPTTTTTTTTTARMTTTTTSQRKRSTSSKIHSDGEVDRSEGSDDEYGPLDVQLEVSDTKIDLCPEKAAVVVQVICSVAHNQVNPRPLFTISVDGKQLVTRQEGHVISTDYRYTYFYQPTAGGIHRITCRTENSAFTDLAVETYQEIEVREPSLSAPVLTISNSKDDGNVSEAFITEGEDFELTCRVNDGFPSVSQVTLSCGLKTTGPVQDKSATLRVLSKDVVDGQRCRCTAQYATKCYDKEVELILKLKGSSHDGSSLPLVPIGVGLAALVIIAITVVVIVPLCTRRTKVTAGGPDSQAVSYTNRAMENNCPYDPMGEVDNRQGSNGLPPPYLGLPEPLYDSVHDYITPTPDVKPIPCGFLEDGGRAPEASITVENDPRNSLS